MQEVKYVDRTPVSGTVDGLVAALFRDDGAMGATLSPPALLAGLGWTDVCGGIVDPLYVDLLLAAHRYFIGPRDLFARLQDMYMRVPLTTRLSKKHKHLRSQLLHIRLRFAPPSFFVFLSARLTYDTHIYAHTTHNTCHTLEW